MLLRHLVRVAPARHLCGSAITQRQETTAATMPALLMRMAVAIPGRAAVAASRPSMCGIIRWSPAAGYKACVARHQGIVIRGLRLCAPQLGASSAPMAGAVRLRRPGRNPAASGVVMPVLV